MPDSRTEWTAAQLTAIQTLSLALDMSYGKFLASVEILSSSITNTNPPIGSTNLGLLSTTTARNLARVWRPEELMAMKTLSQALGLSHSKVVKHVEALDFLISASSTPSATTEQHPPSTGGWTNPGEGSLADFSPRLEPHHFMLQKQTTGVGDRNSNNNNNNNPTPFFFDENNFSGLASIPDYSHQDADDLLPMFTSELDISLFRSVPPMSTFDTSLDVQNTSFPQPSPQSQQPNPFETSLLDSITLQHRQVPISPLISHDSSLRPSFNDHDSGVASTYPSTLDQNVLSKIDPLSPTDQRLVSDPFSGFQFSNNTVSQPSHALDLQLDHLTADKTLPTAAHNWSLPLHQTDSPQQAPPPAALTTPLLTEESQSTPAPLVPTFPHYYPAAASQPFSQSNPVSEMGQSFDHSAPVFNGESTVMTQPSIEAGQNRLDEIGLLSDQDGVQNQVPAIECPPGTFEMTANDMQFVPYQARLMINRQVDSTELSEHLSASNSTAIVSATDHNDISRKRKGGVGGTNDIPIPVSWACQRCRIQHKKCMPNPENPDLCNECLKLKMSKYSCYRGPKIIDIVLFRTDTDLYLFANKPQTPLDPTILNRVNLLNQSQTRMLELNQGIGTTLILPVRKFDLSTIQVSSLQSIELDVYRHPYSVARLEELETIINDYIDRNIRVYIETLTKTDPVSRHFLLATLKYREKTGNKFFSDVIRLWTTARMIEGGWHLSGSDINTFEVPPENDMFYLHNAPLVDYQFAGTIWKILIPLRKKVLKQLDEMYGRNKKKEWFGLVLVTFVILHSYGLLMKQQRDLAREFKSKNKYTQMPLIRGIFHGAKIILSGFHYRVKGRLPFIVDWSSEKVRNDMEVIAELGQWEIDLIREVIPLIQTSLESFIALAQSQEFEAPHWFTGQMFVHNWKVPDTPEHSPPAELY